MPNPFPGMNPYLEECYDWRGIHNILIVPQSDSARR